MDKLKEFKEKNRNNDFSLISRDCIGGILYHELGLRFLSPTINLYLTPEDFNYFVLHLKTYLSSRIIESKEDNLPNPVGIIKPKNKPTLKAIKVYFMHYDSFKEARSKWIKRKKRINYKNIYIVSSFCYIGETKLLSKKLIKDWNKIKYKKMVYVDKPYGFDNEFIISKNNECTEYAWLLYIEKDMDGLRTFNKFDFIEFLNS